MADSFEQALSTQTADELRPLLELAIDAMTKAIIKSDDSSGIQSEALGRLLRPARFCVAAGFARPPEAGALDGQGPLP